MRKTLIALILVLPMVFVLVIFSSVNLVSLGVNISVNGITIRAEGTDKEGTLFVDMADKIEHTISAEVSPANATNQEYALLSSDETVATVTKDGKLVPRKEGTVTITAKSNDMSFTDSMSVVIVSSKVYDFDFSVLDGENNVLRETAQGYEAEIPAGTYSYDIDIHPVGFTDYSITQSGDLYAEIEKGERKLFLPFSGSKEFEVSVPDGIDGPLKKKVLLTVKKPAQGEVAVNGSTDFSGIQLVKGTKEVRLYVECNGNYSEFISDHARCISATNLHDGKYILDIEIGEDAGDSFQASIVAGGKRVDFNVTFTEFAFSIFSDMPVHQEGGRREVTLLTGNSVSFYAVSTGGAKDVQYTWEFDGPKEYFTAEGSTATVRPIEGGNYVLRAKAAYGDETDEEEIHLSVVSKVSAIQIANNVKVDLAECYTVAGKEYNSSLELTDSVYPLRVYAYSTAGTGKAGDDVGYTVSDESIAKVDEREGILVPLGDGKVTVTAYWKGNESFGTHVTATLTVNVVKDAVGVKNAPELVKATDAGLKVVLTDNIKLGTDLTGQTLDLDTRKTMLAAHTMRSTYNIAWYEKTTENLKPDLHYVMEFKNDVYGNGKYIDADNFTHAKDSAGVHLIDDYNGPLYFVKYRQMASVAGQDNIAFLVRTDNIKLYGVNLLGCSDSSLEGEDGGYDLSNLNLTGTTLEVNATVDIVNCRIRNGRNVIRAYGGNRSGDHYFIKSISENKGCDSERITVNIEGCILSQGREFILKIGANRALRASRAATAEPQFYDQSGKPYKETGKSNIYGDGKLYDDPWFYQQYVMTDVTLKDSVVETSGLFTVGVESNFAGTFLYEGSDPQSGYYAFTTEWQSSGGTSFASVLRLEGDVRLYDWKDISLIDSSTLIESPIGALHEWLKLDIQSMIDFVCGKNPDSYGTFIEKRDDKEFVHGGIAFYGGGRNYSALDMDGLNEDLKDLRHLSVNISILKDGQGAMQQQGTLLPSAAGTQDFNFYMYGSDSRNNYDKQLVDARQGAKYSGVARVPLFEGAD